MDKSYRIKTFIYMLVLFPFFVPLIFTYIFPTIPVAYIFTWVKAGIGLTALIIYLKIYRMKISKGVMSVIGFALVYILISLVTTIKYDFTFLFAITIVGVVCLFETSIQKEDWTIIRALFYLLFILCLINLICIIIFPSGIINVFMKSVQSKSGEWTWDMYRRVNFLEGDNAFMQYIMPLWLSSAILYHKNHIKRRYYIICLGVINANVILIWSVTSMIGVAILDIASLLIFYKNKKNLSFNKIAITLIILNVLVVILNVQSYFGSIMADVFGKDVSLTGRTEIWQRALSMFSESPIYGYGSGKQIYIVPINGVDTAPHNFILALLLQGGIILLVTFCYFFYESCHYRNEKLQIVQILYAAVLAYGVMCIAETHFLSYGFWITLSVVNCIKYSKDINQVSVSS